MKKYWMMALMGLLLISGSVPVHAEVKIPAAYVALGDSLAAGQTPTSEIDAGYADLIAQELWRNQPFAFYTKELAFPGFTTEDVLERVKSEEAQEVLASANLITLSAGANDLLRLIQVNPADGSLAFEQIQVDFALNRARAHMEAILEELTDRAPDADIYVMGYYFAYPHVRNSQKEGIAKQLDKLNEILKRSAEKAGAVFVSVDESFGDSAVDKLPNRADVHPNILGYQAMANAFFDHYRQGFEVDKWELPEPNPMTFEEIRQMQEQSRNTAGETVETPEEAESALDDLAVRPSESVETDYLALRKALPYV